MAAPKAKPAAARRPGWGNEELQYYTDSPNHVFVRDSALHIRTIKESMHGCGYTSARVKTRQRDGTALFGQCHGRFEFRAQVPWGKGLWPALWMLPRADLHGRWAASGEIDAMEIHGEDPGKTLGSTHFGSTPSARSSRIPAACPRAAWSATGLPTPWRPAVPPISTPGRRPLTTRSTC